MVTFPRGSGVLLHPTSLPGPFGIGDLGAEARAFVDGLAAAGQRYWQVLPLSPTGYADSPYQALSAFAGNPMLLDPRALASAGWLPPGAPAEALPAGRVEYGAAIAFKSALLQRAFEAFDQGVPAAPREAFDAFCRRHAAWLDDYAAFAALKDAHDLAPWPDWPAPLARRQPAALARWGAAHAREIARHKFLQWQFFEQWLALKRRANRAGVRVVGDIPIFVALDSADVWAHPELFHFDDALRPTVVSGVPPDYFSETGQLWGHPLYRWDALARRGYGWWLDRFRMAFLQADVVRVDHFRGFYNHWEVPAGADTAVSGRWVPGPGAALFERVTEALGEVAIIAEDLGDLDADARAGVDALQARFGYPGMRILQFAFGGGSDHPFLPHNFTREAVAYTGTHDNDTAAGWYRATDERTRDRARRYLACDGGDIAWDLIRLGWASVAHTAIAPAQDLLGLGSEGRLNTPGTCGAPNWCWRLPAGSLPPDVTARLRDLTERYGRLSDGAP